MENQRDSPMLGPPIEIYRARGLPEAYAIRNALEAQAIPANIENELLQGAIGDLPMGWATAPRILVDRRNEMAARAILADFLQKIQATVPDENAPLKCLACGSAMENGYSCPTCGWSYLRDEADEDDIPV
jgi:hypothetical protein